MRPGQQPVFTKMAPVFARKEPDENAQKAAQGAGQAEGQKGGPFDKTLKAHYSFSVADLIDNLRGDMVINTAKAFACIASPLSLRSLSSCFA